MSLNITVATPKLIVCTTDRRLTYADTGRILTERSTKLTHLLCKDALCLVTYNGVGNYRGQTPSQWLSDLEDRVRLTQLSFKDVLQAIKKDAEQRISGLPAACDHRHTFVLAAWGRGRTWLCVISNYENACSDHVHAKAQAEFTVSAMTQSPGNETRIIVTGSVQHFDGSHLATIGSVARKSGAAGIDIKNLCVRAIQDASNRCSRKGPIGSSVIWAVAERFGGVEGGLDVLGGTRVHEMPNLIAPGVRMSDIRIESPHGSSISWGKPFPLPETSCPKCGLPLPLGYRTCGVCGASIR